MDLNSILIGSEDLDPTGRALHQLFGHAGHEATVATRGWQLGVGWVTVGPHTEAEGKTPTRAGSSGTSRPQTSVATSARIQGRRRHRRRRAVRLRRGQTGISIATFADLDDNYFELMSPMEPDRDELPRHDRSRSQPARPRARPATATPARTAGRRGRRRGPPGRLRGSRRRRARRGARHPATSPRRGPPTARGPRPTSCSTSQASWLAPGRAAAEVRAGGDPHARGRASRTLSTGPVAAGPPDRRRGSMNGSAVVCGKVCHDAMHGQRGDEEGPALGHLGADAGIELVAVLQRVDPAADAGARTGQVRGVGGHAGVAPVRELDHSPHLRGAPGRGRWLGAVEVQLQQVRAVIELLGRDRHELVRVRGLAPMERAGQRPASESARCRRHGHTGSPDDPASGRGRRG